jgi:hypothetical protein
MNMVHLQLPDSLYKQLSALAEQDGVSVNQLLTLAAAEKVSALLTVGYLQERARQGKREDFETLLAKVPSVEPEEFDRL